MTYLFYNWKFEPFEPFHRVHPTPHPQPLVTTNLVSPSLLTCHSGTVLGFAQAVQQEPLLFPSWEARQSRSLGDSEKFTQLTTLPPSGNAPSASPALKQLHNEHLGWWKVPGLRAGRSARLCPFCRSLPRSIPLKC